MMQLIGQFQEAGYAITMASAAKESPFMENLQQHGIQQVSIKLNHASFDDFVRKLNPAVVLFDRYMTEEQFGWRVAENSPNALRILDTEDLHCLREARHSAWKKGENFQLTDLHSDIAFREIAAIWRCDLSLIISEFEMELLRTHFRVDERLLHYLPFMFGRLEHKQIQAWPDFKARKHFVSIGNFLHEPNWNAVLFLKEEIWPLIRKQLPDAELHIYGAYTPKKAMQLHNEHAGFIIKGRAEDSAVVMRNAKVLLAPLRFGAGLKGKLAEAMQNGMPSVTTSVGAEGMNGELLWPGFIADNALEFANAAVRLYEHEKLWAEAQENGVHIINQRFQKQEHGAAMLSKVQQLETNPEAHRQHNFTGAMLRHHSMASTRFMSKWIEEKQRNSGKA